MKPADDPGLDKALCRWFSQKQSQGQPTLVHCYVKKLLISTKSWEVVILLWPAQDS